MSLHAAWKPRGRRGHRSLIAGVALAVAATVALGGTAAASPARQHTATRTESAGVAQGGSGGELPSPPRPPTGPPEQPAGYRAPTAAPHGGSGAPAATRTAANADASVAPPSEARSWGAAGSATTLVLYDSTGSWGWLGELYAIGAGNLATHFGRVTAEPVLDYLSGQVNDYTATIYLGSTYNEPIPTDFLNDVLTTSKPVIWVGDNIWQLSGTEGGTADQAFQATYGWDPATSYIDTSDAISQVAYNSQTFTRGTDNTAGVLAPHVTDPSTVRVLASADCSDSGGAPTACAEIAQTTGDSFPWAISSANLMYVGEIPFSYISQTDRYVAFAGLLFDDLDPAAQQTHQALVRIEDVNPTSSPTLLRQYVDYLHSQGVPFSVGVIPEYTDPTGHNNHGVPETLTLASSPELVAALEYAQSMGGTIIEHGYTHQYSDVPNPYDGVTADDFEFYRAQCSSTEYAPYNYQAPCPNTDWVIEEGPLPGDSQVSAATRVALGRTLFTLAGLPEPTIWETPHYAASAADYAGIDEYYQTRYETELFFGGQLTGQPIDYSHVFGQFFPYEVHDLYGTTIVPENLGDYEPTEVNNNPPRTADEIVGEAQQNLAVTQGVASFFIHSDYDPVSALEQVVQGIRGLGYTFVSPATLLSSGAGATP